jgi:hypothetical protein
MGEAPLVLFLMPVFFGDPAIWVCNSFKLVQTFAVGNFPTKGCTFAGERFPALLHPVIFLWGNADAREHVAAEGAHFETFDFGA